MARVTEVTPAQAARIFRRLPRELRATDDELRRGYALDVMRQAQRNAARRPTPQARGIASTLRVSRRGGAVLGLPSATAILSGRSVKAAGINYGAEYGSDTHRQFAPRRERGYWLNPAADEIDDESGEQWLDAGIDRAIERGRRGF